MGKTRKIVGDLYRLDFIDGKSYIGACIGKAKSRYGSHRRSVKKESTHPVHKAWRELGPPVMVILKENVPEEKLWIIEKRFIAKFQTQVPNGYNAYPGSDSPPGMFGKSLSSETKREMSKVRRGKTFSNEVKTNMSNGQFQRFKDPKEREKISVAKKLYFKDPAAIEKNRQAHLGEKFTEERKENIRQALIKHYDDPEARERQRQGQLGKKHSPETKDKMSLSRSGEANYFYGKKHTEEAKQKNRNAHVGKKQSEATKEKNRQAQLTRFKDPLERKKMSLGQQRRRQRERDATNLT